MAQQQIIDYGNVPNDGTGDSLRDAFIKTDDNFSAIWAAGPVGSNIKIEDNTISALNTNGNIILKPNGIGVIQVNNSVLPRINGVYSLGSESLRFRQGYFRDLDINGELTGNFSLSNVQNISVAGTVTAQNVETPNLSAGDSGPIAIASPINVAGDVDVDGNISGDFIEASYFIGDGSQLTNLTVAAGTEIVNGNSNVRVSENGPVTMAVGGQDQVFVVDLSNVTTSLDIVPRANLTGNIGIDERVWQYMIAETIRAVGNIEAVGKVIAAEFEGDGANLRKTLTDKGFDTNNWNTLREMGVYKVNRTSWSGTTGTPLDSDVFVGLLQVLTASDTTTQIFLPGTVVAGDQRIQWNRSYWNGAWTGWIRIVNNGQIIDAGTF